METCPKLTPTQALLLRAAARRADGRVIPPANLRGGARVKAMTALMRREWIEAGDGGQAPRQPANPRQCWRSGKSKSQAVIEMRTWLPKRWWRAVVGRKSYPLS